MLEKLVEGLSIQEPARSLWLSPNTVRTHRLHIYRKLGAHTREELVEAAGKPGSSPRVNSPDTVGNSALAS